MMYFMSDESFQSTQLRGEPFSYGPMVSPYAYACLEGSAYILDFVKG